MAPRDTAVQPIDDLAQALGLGRQRGDIVLKLGVALAQIGVFARQGVGSRAHERCRWNSGEKSLGTTTAAAAQSADTAKSTTITNLDQRRVG